MNSGLTCETLENDDDTKILIKGFIKTCEKLKVRFHNDLESIWSMIRENQIDWVREHQTFRRKRLWKTRKGESNLIKLKTEFLKSNS